MHFLTYKHVAWVSISFREAPHLGGYYGFLAPDNLRAEELGAEVAYRTLLYRIASQESGPSR